MASGFIWPFQTEASNQFERVDQGWDLQSTAGAPVYAVADGVVGQSAPDPGGFGNDYPYETLDSAPSGAPSNTVYYGHIHIVPGLVGKHVTAGTIVGYTNTADGQNGSAAPPGWLEIGFASPGTGAPVQHGEGATGAGQAMKSFLTGAMPAPGQAQQPAAQAAAGATTTNADGTTTTLPAPPPITDLPALDTYVQENFPTESWLLTIPTVRSVVENAVANGLDKDQVQALVAATPWWQHTSQTMVAFDQLKNQTPEELNFNDPGTKAASVLANIKNVAGTVGVNFTPAELQSVALEAMQFGWSNQEIQAKLGSMVNVTTQGAGVTSNDPQMLAQLEASAGAYLYNPNQTVLNQYAQGIASGKMTIDTFNAFLAQQAATKYPSMAEQIKAGMTPAAIIDPLRTEAATTMEVSPNSINFISDPTYSKILNYTPPPVAGKAQAPRVMTTSEMDTYLRSTGQYSYTQGARNSASDLSDTIVKAFGKVAS